MKLKKGTQLQAESCTKPMTQHGRNTPVTQLFCMKAETIKTGGHLCVSFFPFHVIVCVCVFDCVHVCTVSVYMRMYMYVVSACMCVMYVCMRCVCQLDAM